MRPYVQSMRWAITAATTALSMATPLCERGGPRKSSCAMIPSPALVPFSELNFGVCDCVHALLLEEGAISVTQGGELVCGLARCNSCVYYLTCFGYMGDIVGFVLKMNQTFPASSSDITYTSNFSDPLYPYSESNTDALWLNGTFFIGRCSRSSVRRPIQGFPYINTSISAPFLAGSYTMCSAILLAKSFDETVMVALYFFDTFTFQIDVVVANETACTPTRPISTQST